MKILFFPSILILSALGLSASANAQMLAFTGSFSENFDSYRGSAATLPSGFAVGTGTYQGTGTGSSNTGGYYAFAATGNTTDYSFGVLRSGTGTFTLSSGFTNNTGATLTSLTIGLDYEQYRFVNASGFTVTPSGALAGQDLTQLNFTGTATGTNGTPATTAATLTIPNLSIASGQAFGFVFTASDATGSDNGVAIDNFTLSGVNAAVPEPSTYAMMAGAFGLLLVGQRIRRTARA